MYQLIIFLSIAACTTGQLITSGDRIYTSLKNFDNSKFTGVWYQYARIPNRLDGNTICTSSLVTMNPNGTLQTRIHGFNLDTGYIQSWGGLAIPYEPSKFDYIFPPGVIRRNFKFQILDGDDNLEHYAAIVITQKVSYDISLEYAWILTRYPQLEENYYKNALNVFNLNNINTNALEFVRYWDCPNI